MIVFASPCTGKSYLNQHHPDRFYDAASWRDASDNLDSWYTSTSTTCNKVLAQGKTLLFATHRSYYGFGFDAMIRRFQQDGHSVLLVRPERRAKEEYMERRRQFPHPDRMYDIEAYRLHVEKNWDKWMDDLEPYTGAPQLILKPYEFLSDHITEITTHPT